MACVFFSQTLKEKIQTIRRNNETPALSLNEYYYIPHRHSMSNERFVKHNYCRMLQP